MTKKRTVPFNIYNRCYYWLGYNMPRDLNIAVGFYGEIDIDVLKLACKKTILKTPVLKTNIKTYFVFLKRKDAGLASDFDINDYFTTSDRRLENPGGIDKTSDDKTSEFLNSKIDIDNDIPIKFFYSKGLEKEDCVFILKLSQTVCDIKGAYIVISKIFQEYNTLTQTPNKIALPSEPQSYSLNSLKHLSRFRKADKSEKYRVSFFRDNNSFSGTMKKITLILDNDYYSNIIKFSDNHSYSLCDILFTALALSSSNILSEKGGLERFMRFGYSVDLRNNLGFEGGISNFSSFLDILLEKDELKNPKSALKTIHEKMLLSFKKHIEIKRAFRINFYKYFPSKILAKYYVAREKMLFKKPFFTSFLSNSNNLENILEMPGECKLTYSWVSSFPHFSFGLNWNICSYEDQLFVTLNFLEPVIAEDTAYKLINYFKNSLDDILAT